MSPEKNAAGFAGTGGTANSEKSTPVRMGARAMPASDVECFAVAALKHPEGRARFRNLGLGPECFQNGDLASLAAALIAERPFTPHEQRVMAFDDGRTLPLGMAIGWTGSPEASALWIGHFAEARIRYWLPRWLSWVWSEVRSGCPLSRVQSELQALADELRGVAA